MTALPIPPDADIVPAPVSDGFTVAEFLDWVRTKPADEAYDYSSLDNCAISQFARYAGFELHGEERNLFESGAGGMAACLKPNTFGALATRLQALLP